MVERTPDLADLEENCHEQSSLRTGPNMPKAAMDVVNMIARFDRKHIDPPYADLGDRFRMYWRTQYSRAIVKLKEGDALFFNNRTMLHPELRITIPIGSVSGSFEPRSG